MHTFIENFQQDGKQYARISNNQAELTSEETFVDQKPLSISDLQIDYLNLDNSVRST